MVVDQCLDLLVGDREAFVPGRFHHRARGGLVEEALAEEVGRGAGVVVVHDDARRDVLGVHVADLVDHGRGPGAVLHVGPEKLGLLMSMIAIGSLIGAMGAASLRESFNRKGLLLLVGIAVLGGSILAFSFSRSYVLAAVLMVPVGLGQASRTVLNNALVLTNTPTQFQGRVMSLYMMMFGFQPLGSMPMGFLADQFGIAPVLGVAGAVLAAFAILMMALAPSVRRLS